MSIQGVLKDADGNILFDGNYEITYKLYLTPEDGFPLWEELHENIALKNGIFHVLLGSIEPLDLPFDSPYFLGISIENGPELTPRIPLAATPYSLSANSLNDGSVTTSKIENNAITVDKIEPNIISSINGIGSDGDTIVFVGGDNKMVVPDTVNNTIMISAIGTAAGDITAVNAGSGLKSGGNEGAVSIDLDTSFISTRYVRVGGNNTVTNTMIQENAISAPQILPNIVSSINGVTNDGSNIDLVAGSNVSIVANDALNSITISSTPSAGDSSGVFQINGDNTIAISAPAGPTVTLSNYHNILV